VSPCCREYIFFGGKCLVVVVKTPFFVNKVLEGGGPDHASKIAWQIGSDTFKKESDHTTGL
jgi:hypothetical protein